MSLAAELDTFEEVRLPPKMVGLFDGEYRFRGAKGGRGSGKTRGFALMTAVKGYIYGNEGRQGQILCAREHLNSIDESSLTEVKMAIQEHPFLLDYYEIGEKYIRSKDGRIEYVFTGLRRNLNSIKSKARLLLCWVDEAEAVPESAWRILIPTVREDNSEIWVSWNPEVKASATDNRFIKNPSDDMKIITMNFRDNPWFPAVLEADRLNDMVKRPDTYEHIWEGAYLEYAEGAYYIDELRKAKEEKRIGKVPYDTAMAVTTSWDLGMGDSTAIWFTQQVGQEVRVIDYYENDGVALDHYVKVLQDKPYIYDNHILPHDVKVRELGTGKSRLEVLGTLGLKHITVCGMVGVDDGIQAARALINRCWFDEEKTAKGLDCLRQYRREYNDKTQAWHNRPLHDWCSHAADAFRYRAVGYRRTTGWGKPIRRNLKGIA